MKGLVRQSLPTEQRKVAGSIPAPATHQRGQLTRLGSDWPVPVATVNRSRCGRSLVRCGLTSAWKCPCQAFWVLRSSARHHRRTQLRSYQSVLGESESIHSRTLGLWRSAGGAAGCGARGSGSTCRWRRSAVVRIPAFRAGDREGRNAATPGRNRIRRPVSGAPRRRPRRRARRRRQTWHRRGCPMTELVQIVAGLSQAARDGARQRASILD